MKKIYAFLFTLLLASGAAAQNPTAYFMEGSTLRSQFNPAFAPLRGDVNIPAPYWAACRSTWPATSHSTTSSIRATASW